VNRSAAHGKEPTVGIVIPVYNRLTYLGATLESVLGQTHSAWQLVVVDDGSQEDVAGFVRTYADPRITLLQQDNQGNGAARNLGIAATKSPYVICLDSDDVWEPCILETCVAALEADPAVDVVYTQHQAIDAEGHALWRAPGPAPLSGDLLEPVLLGHPIPPSSALMRRDCVERWGGYTPGMDDWELWLRWAVAGCRFRCISEPLLMYRIHDRNLSLDWDRRLKAHMAMLDAFYSRPDLRERAMTLRDRAYARQHLIFAQSALQLGRREDATRQLVKAIRLNPGYAVDLDVWTQLACAHQGRIDEGTVRSLDWDRADSDTNEMLSALITTPELAGIGQRPQRPVRCSACLALARHAYGVAQDMPRCRSYLRSALSAWPPALWRTDWLPWAVRASIGYEWVQRAKRALKGTRA
jgi:glycosyltransferase involved in cell wall biosynthesis